LVSIPCRMTPAHIITSTCACLCGTCQRRPEGLGCCSLLSPSPSLSPSLSVHRSEDTTFVHESLCDFNLYLQMQVGTRLLLSEDVRVMPEGRAVMWKGEEWEVIEDSFGVDGMRTLFAGATFRRSSL
jgi:hypothetical protein